MQLTDDTLSLRADTGEGHAAAWCSAISLSSPHLFIFISAYSISPSLSWFIFFFFWGGLPAPSFSLPPCKPFLIFLSVINLYLTDSILLYPAHIFFHLPPRLSPSSIALSPDAQESVNWLQEHELDVCNGEHRTLSGPQALFSYFKNLFSPKIVWFNRCPAVTLLGCKKKSKKGSSVLCHLLRSPNTWQSCTFREPFPLRLSINHVAHEENQSIFLLFRFLLGLLFKRNPLTTFSLGVTQSNHLTVAGLMGIRKRI